MIAKIPRDQLPRRPFQRALERAVLAAATRPPTDDPADRTVVVDVHPGSGKTTGYLAAADALVEAGIIDVVVVLAPRLNLAVQAETDWEALRVRYDSVMGPITQRDNRLPLLRDGAYGYVTTYQSLLANPDIHEAFCRGRRVLLVLDEAQGLGDETPEGLGTRSAEAVRRLGRLARLIVVLSGTPTRGDGAPLVYARYAAPDEAGWRELIADVRASYQDGVAGRYLRGFEAELIDGVGIWSPFAAATDAAPETLELATLRGGLARLIGQPGYWRALVDRGVARVATLKRDLDPRLQGLIAAADQTQAKAICAYLAQAHPSVRVLLATQDETLAQRNLAAFRAGAADILVTCAMAHVGYDCAPIAVVVVLTTIRQEAWLRQLIARGLRVMSGLDPDAQCCHIVVPDDPQMREFVERLRGECAAGLLARPPREAGARADGEADGGGNAGVGGYGVGLGAYATGRRAQGLDPADDADAAELAHAEALCRDCQISPAVPMTKIVKLIKLMRGAATPAPAASDAETSGPHRHDQDTPLDDSVTTARDRERELRRACAEIARRCDGWIGEREPGWAYGETNRRAKRALGTPIDACGVAELQGRLAWLKTFFGDEVRRRTGEGAA